MIGLERANKRPSATHIRLTKMGKSTKVSTVGAVKLPSLKDDSAIIARDFATFGQFTANNDARIAMLRRVTDAEAFKQIRDAACVAWLEHKGYDAARALAIIDGTLANPNAKIGNREKRTEAEQKDYARAKSAWSYYLECNGVTQLARAPAKPRAPQAPGAKAPADKKADALASFTAKAYGDMSEAIQFYDALAALMSKAANANSKILKGDAGTILRTLTTHVSHEVARAKAANK